MQVVSFFELFFASRFVFVSLPVFTSAFVLSSSCLGDKNRAEAAAILSTLLTVARTRRRRGQKKHDFQTNMCVSGGPGKDTGGSWVLESVFFKARMWYGGEKGGGVWWSDGEAAAASRERSPERELQVQPAGPWASGEKATSVEFDFFPPLSRQTLATSVAFQHQRVFMKSSPG